MTPCSYLTDASIHTKHQHHHYKHRARQRTIPHQLSGTQASRASRPVKASRSSAIGALDVPAPPRDDPSALEPLQSSRCRRHCPLAGRRRPAPRRRRDRSASPVRVRGGNHADGHLHQPQVLPPGAPQICITPNRKPISPSRPPPASNGCPGRCHQLVAHEVLSQSQARDPWPDREMVAMQKAPPSRRQNRRFDLPASHASNPSLLCDRLDDHHRQPTTIDNDDEPSALRVTTASWYAYKEAGRPLPSLSFPVLPCAVAPDDVCAFEFGTRPVRASLRRPLDLTLAVPSLALLVQP